MITQKERLSMQQMQNLSLDEQDKIIEKVKSARQIAKGAGYALQYGSGAATVARTAGVPLPAAEIICSSYHDLNWSIGVIAENTKTKKANGMTWQLNPVNNLWYWLKSDKDRFSTLCQGTGAYITDTWIESCHEVCREKYGINAPVIAEFHDELVMRVKDSIIAKAAMERIVLDAMELVNTIVQCNVTFACEIKFGENYSAIH